MAALAPTRELTPLARIIAEQGRRQVWLAQTTGYNRTYINYLATGRVAMTPSAAVKLGHVLGVRPEVLMPAGSRASAEEVRAIGRPMASD